MGQQQDDASQPIRVGRPPTCDCGECKKCKHRAYQKARWERMTLEERRAEIAKRDKAKVRASDQRRYRKDAQRRLDAQKRWRAANPEKANASHNDAAKTWVERNPEKRKAHVAVSNALRRGKLVKGSCAQEGPDCSGRIEAHHEDYDKPLEVTWLCSRHHGETRRRAA